MSIPTGWGVGVALNNECGGPTVYNQAAVVEALHPDWWYNWHFSEASAPEDTTRWVPHVSQIWRYRDKSFGHIPEDAFYLIGNEPERMDNAAEFAQWTRYQVDEIAQARKRFKWGGPAFILTSLGRWFVSEWIDRLEQYEGNMFPHAIVLHIYYHDWRAINHHLIPFWDWHASTAAGVPVIIKEISAGLHARKGQHAEIMNHARYLMDDPRVAGIAWFGSQPYLECPNAQGQQTMWTSNLLNHNLQLTPLGHMWRALKLGPLPWDEFGRLWTRLCGG